MAYSLPTAKQLGAKLDQIAKSKVKDVVQEVIVAAIGHALQYGDTRIAWRCVEAAGKAGLQVDALVRYAEEFGPLKLTRNDGGAAIGFKLTKKAMTFDGEALMAGDPWYRFAKQARDVKSTYDVLARILAAAQKAVDKQAEGTSVEHAELIAELEPLLKKHGKALDYTKLNAAKLAASEPAVM